MGGGVIVLGVFIGIGLSCCFFSLHYVFYVRGRPILFLDMWVTHVKLVTAEIMFGFFHSISIVHIYSQKCILKMPNVWDRTGCDGTIHDNSCT